MDTYTIIRGMAQVWFSHVDVDDLNACELFKTIQEVVRSLNSLALFDGNCLDKDGTLQLTLDLYEFYRGQI